ncbi:uncharacterized protein [Choristoneura fumiferana]|uniref:uncharacterized protein n=1 Tax=Choristoneura fumiferana TaxID=7141 RepID=UPI003D158D3F
MPAAKCDACGKFTAAYDAVGCAACSRSFHYQCLSIASDEFKKLPKDARKVRKCYVCKTEERSIKTPTRGPSGPTNKNVGTATVRGSDHAPPAGAATAVPLEPPPTTVTDTAEFSPEQPKPNYTTELEKRLTDLIKISHDSLKAEVGRIIKAEIARHSAAVTEELNHKIVLLEEKSERIQELEKMVTASEERILQLEKDFGSHQQWLRMNNLEVSGVPELANESPSDITIQIARHAGVTLQPDDIEFAHRVQPVQTQTDRPKNIVVKLRRRSLKDKILSGLKKSRGVNTADIGIGGDSRKIFVHDHLTPANKFLLKNCKKICSEKGYEYVWVKNCSIYVRKADKQPYIHVRSALDFRKIA